MTKLQLKSWAAAREELQNVATDQDCDAYDRAIVDGNKITAIRILRTFGITLYVE